MCVLKEILSHKINEQTVEPHRQTAAYRLDQYSGTVERFQSVKIDSFSEEISVAERDDTSLLHCSMMDIVHQNQVSGSW